MYCGERHVGLMGIACKIISMNFCPFENLFSIQYKLRDVLMDCPYEKTSMTLSFRLFFDYCFVISASFTISAMILLFHVVNPVNMLVIIGCCLAAGMFSACLVIALMEEGSLPCLLVEFWHIPLTGTVFGMLPVIFFICSRNNHYLFAQTMPM